MEIAGSVETVQQLQEVVHRDACSWEKIPPKAKPWFRGQFHDLPPIPSVFREDYAEHEMINMFRYRAPAFSSVPGRTGHTDEWLFLAQHYGVPTRLLDWTESLLVSLFFVVWHPGTSAISAEDQKADGALWMLHPLKLNEQSESIGKPVFPNPWANFPGNVVRNNIDYAFWDAGRPTCFPIAIQTTYRKRLMSAQSSCFTVHGSLEDDFEKILGGHKLSSEGYFRKYRIPATAKTTIRNELDLLGISHSTVFPDLRALGIDLRRRFAV